jgi:Fe-S oxidoreductase
MNESLIYLCDLTHTSHGVVSEFVPYGIGCIKSFFHAHSRFGAQAEVKLFKYPNDLAEAFPREMPGVVGLSNYIWNSELAYAFARRIKELAPETLIVMGGPNYPLEDDQQQAWLAKRPAVDLYTTGEGEETFTRIMDLWLADRASLAKPGALLRALTEAGVDGCHAVVDGRLVKSGNGIPRLADLDGFPSPYLEGYLDPFLDGTANIPLIETTRGCPFTCAYCERGSRNWAKLTRKSPAVFEAEMEVIATKTKATVLLLADSNFGMYPQDVDISRMLKSCQDRHGYPLYVSVSTGKNAEENILACVDILGDSLPLTASVQSLDPEVLRNIKRQNVSAEKLIGMAKSARSRDSITRSEVILALPGDSKDKHFDTIFQLLDAGMDFILPYTLMLLDGSELNTTPFRQRYRMDTRFRLSHRCHGNYPFAGKNVHAAEIEEVVVGLDTMSFADYLECRAFALTASIFYSDDILFELFRYLAAQGIAASTFTGTIHARRAELMDTHLAGLYSSFEADTENELWADRETLLAVLERGDEEEIRQRVVGYNILFKHRALAFFEHVEGITRTAFQVARGLLPQQALTESGAYLDELERYSMLKKINPFDFTKTYEGEFHYDFPALEEARFKGAPRSLDTPVRLVFAHSDKQTALLAGFEQSIEGAMRAIPRLSVPKIYRQVHVE